MQVSAPNTATIAPAQSAAAATTRALGEALVAAATAQALQLARVYVLAVLPDGRIKVQIDGQEELAVSTAEVAAGGKYVLQVERTPTGLVLGEAPDSPELAQDIAAAVLRSASPPNLGAALKPLLEELASLQARDGAALPTPAASTGPRSPVLQAAAAVKEAVDSFLPADARALTATELKNLIEDGGLHFEAKLARLVEDISSQTSEDGGREATDYATSSAPAARQGSPAGTDLKEALLRLLQAAQELGESFQMPAARSALEGIEAQQAANVFAQAQDTPYLLQIPFPDDGEWKTLHLAIDPEGRRQPGSGAGKNSSFRMLMHVPLADLGDTWIDAGLSGDRLRAVFYLSDANARDRVRAELPSLRSELVAGGFGEALLDVRPAADLPSQQRRQAAAMRLGRPGAGSILDVSV